MKYGIRVCTEGNPKGSPLKTPFGSERMLFNNKIDAVVYAVKVRNESSLGAYFKIDEINE